MKEQIPDRSKSLGMITVEGWASPSEPRMSTFDPGTNHLPVSCVPGLPPDRPVDLAAAEPRGHADLEFREFAVRCMALGRLLGEIRLFGHLALRHDVAVHAASNTMIA